jgi:serine phosphatase RsbU (regulator of sigma subunit)
MVTMGDASGGRKALVIEDNADIRGLLETSLQRQGFQTSASAGGYAALETARSVRPDLITLDLGLPDLDGLEVCKALRAFTEAYILVISARADEADRLTALELGADDYLGKPFSPRELRLRVEALLRRPRGSEQPSESELQTAARVQRGLLPDNSPALPGYDLAGACRPSRSVGGDFFDWEADGSRLAVTLADAMGKGMGAALVAATARAVLRPGRLQRSAESLVGRAAAALEPDLTKLSSFVTLMHWRLDGMAGEVEYVDAGHGLGILVHPDGLWERLGSSGPPLGLLPGAQWRGETVLVPPGAQLVAVSDGLLDAFDAAEPALDAVASAVHAAGSAREAVDAVLALAVHAEDDVTAVVLRRELALEGAMVA